MVSVNQLKGILGTLSIKLALQKICFQRAQSWLTSFVATSDGFPVKISLRDAPVAYRSAIALKLAASQPQDAAAIAHQLVEVFTSKVTHTSGSTLDLHHMIADKWIGRADAQGGIMLQLSDRGITAWLQHLNTMMLDLSLLDLSQGQSKPIPSPQLDPQSYFSPQFFLCSRLQLSLPMLLQFSHARCCLWLRKAEQPGDQAFANLPEQNPDPPTSQSAWGWFSQSPKACHTLLQAIVQALDAMAVQKGDPMTCLRHGYVLAEAIYALQAAIPLSRVSMLPAAVQISLWSVVRAAQQSLSLIISGVLQQKPVENF